MPEIGESESAPSSRLAVVGARGFLGKSIAAAARAAGHAVHEFEVDTPAVLGEQLAGGIEGCDVVYWLASRCNPATAELHPEWAQADSADFALFLELVRELAQVPRVILASSGGTIYGSGTPPFSEDSPLAPTGRYGAAKRAAEEILSASGVPGAAARISNPYGPGQKPGTGQGVVAQWLDDILNSRSPVLIGSPRTARDFVYVQDIAEGMLALGVAAYSGPMNLGAGSPTTLEELAATLAQITGTHVDFRESPARSFDIPATWLTIDRAKDVLHWAPTTTLREGLERTWADLQSMRGMRG